MKQKHVSHPRMLVAAAVAALYAVPAVVAQAADIKVDVTPIMKQTDRNGDGSISATEFTAMAAEGFARRDRNGDGTVTPDELQALGK